MTAQTEEDHAALIAQFQSAFAVDFHTLTKFVREHLGDEAAIEALIVDMARYRAEAMAAMSSEIMACGRAWAESEFVAALGELQ